MHRPQANPRFSRLRFERYFLYAGMFVLFTACVSSQSETRGVARTTEVERNVQILENTALGVSDRVEAFRQVVLAHENASLSELCSVCDWRSLLPRRNIRATGAMSLYVHFENTSQGPIYLLTVDLGDSTASFAETTVYIQLSTPVNEALLAQYFRGGETVPREITILDVAW